MARFSDVSRLRDAFEEFQSIADEARNQIEKTPRFEYVPKYRSQAYAMLMEAHAWAYNFAITPRLNPHPQMYWQSTWHGNIYGLGMPIGDFRYGCLFLDGRKTYRLTGRLGDVKLQLMQVHTHLLGHPKSEEIGNYDFHTAFDLGHGGSYEVIISATPHDGNWIRLDPESDCNFVLTRRIVGDWEDDLGHLSISEVDSTSDCAAGGQWDVDMAGAISSGANFLKYLINDYMIGLYDTFVERANGKKNAWAAMPGRDVATSLIGSQSVVYFPGVFEIEPDEALIVEWLPPRAAYWSFQLGDVWSRPLDHMNHQADLNKERVALDPDGMCRAVVSLQDPEVANWLDPVGNTEGLIVARAYRSEGEVSEPLMRKVPFSELLSHLPDDTRRVSPDERHRTLDYRRQATWDFVHR